MRVTCTVFAALLAALGMTLGLNDVSALPLQASSAGAGVIRQAADAVRENDSAGIKLVRQEDSRRDGYRHRGGNRGKANIRRGGPHKFRGDRSGTRHYKMGQQDRVRRYDRSRKSTNRVRDRGNYKRRVYPPRRTVKRFDKRRYLKRVPARKWSRSRHRSRKFRHYHLGWYYDYPWWLYFSAWPYYDYGYDDDHIAWCFSRYRSYDPRTNTFLGYDGRRHECISPYSY